MSTSIHPRLPASFTSLYRLLLRTCSATVLHHRLATRNLRQLWRPTFDEAAKITRELQANGQDANAHRLKKDWLKIWEQRMDNTLAILYNSCKTRGLPHQLTRNLGFLVLSEHQRLRGYQYPVWSPQLPPRSPFYHSVQTLDKGQKVKEENRKKWAEFDENAWSALSQVVRMAEGRQEISLGQIAIKKRAWRTRRGKSE